MPANNSDPVALFEAEQRAQNWHVTVEAFYKKLIEMTHEPESGVLRALMLSAHASHADGSEARIAAEEVSEAASHYREEIAAREYERECDDPYDRKCDQRRSDIAEGGW